MQSVCAWHGEGADPADGSAAVSSPQSKFVGSDRQGRGKLVARLREGPVHVVDASGVMGFSGQPERVERVLNSLVADGLVERTKERLHLPS